MSFLLLVLHKDQIGGVNYIRVLYQQISNYQLFDPSFFLERFTKVLLEQQQDRARREQERIRLLTADPFDLEAQAKIEEDIR